MSDPERGTTIVFNGMIYNFRDLREQLQKQGQSFASDCDTEVVLKAYGRYGRDCVRYLRGMFAFAIWDAPNNELFLARDRLGIKPLYYWQNGSEFLFASQVKALLRSGVVPAVVSLSGIQTFLEFGAVSEPLTSIEGVMALPAGHTGVLRGGSLELARYWQFPDVSAFLLERTDAASELRALLEDTVRTHLVSDAPLGVFLSGGLDSSILAALAARETPKLRTISIVFDDPSFSEEPYVDAVMKRVGSDHVRVMLTPEDVLAWLGEAFNAMDQPTFDGINTYVVSRAAHESGLKVALSGVGGDELFDGYGQLPRLRRLERLRRLPSPVRRLGKRAAAVAVKGTRHTKAEAWLDGAFSRGSSYELLRRLFLPDDVARLLNIRIAGEDLPRPDALDPRRELNGQLSILELTNYTRNVLLRDTDAMSMGNSLEVRVPYLDSPLVEWALKLRAATKGTGKELLVHSVRDLLPDEIVRRPKQGFLLPIGPWMRRELKPEVERTLASAPEIVAALVGPVPVLDIWREFEHSRRGWLEPWALYAFYKWAASVDEIVAHAKTGGTARSMVTSGDHRASPRS